MVTGSDRNLSPFRQVWSLLSLRCHTVGISALTCQDFLLFTSALPPPVCAFSTVAAFTVKDFAPANERDAFMVKLGCAHTDIFFYIYIKKKLVFLPK